MYELMNHDTQRLECYTGVKMNEVNVMNQHRESLKGNAKYRKQVVERPLLFKYTNLVKFIKRMLY